MGNKERKYTNSIVVLARKGTGGGSYIPAGRYRVGAKTMKEAEQILIEYLKPTHYKISAYYIEENKTLPYGMVIKQS